ncbi:hypothetical protein R3P38DRAFT_3492195 [Favolaschia claudopus]|uniref:Uncharacterized protein n=1 Tax=Favolaschia claudopus TaxID=2862362 RepID=A0AAW0EDF8_9AGAR
MFDFFGSSDGHGAIDWIAWHTDLMYQPFNAALKCFFGRCQDIRPTARIDAFALWFNFEAGDNKVNGYWDLVTTPIRFSGSAVGFGHQAFVELARLRSIQPRRLACGVDSTFNTLDGQLGQEGENMLAVPSSCSVLTGSILDSNLEVEDIGVCFGSISHKLVGGTEIIRFDVRLRPSAICRRVIFGASMTDFPKLSAVVRCRLVFEKCERMHALALSGSMYEDGILQENLAEASGAMQDVFEAEYMNPNRRGCKVVVSHRPSNKSTSCSGVRPSICFRQQVNFELKFASRTGWTVNGAAVNLRRESAHGFQTVCKAEIECAAENGRRCTESGWECGRIGAGFGLEFKGLGNFRSRARDGEDKVDRPESVATLHTHKLAEKSSQDQENEQSPIDVLEFPPVAHPSRRPASQNHFRPTNLMPRFTPATFSELELAKTKINSPAARAGWAGQHRKGENTLARGLEVVSSRGGLRETGAGGGKETRSAASALSLGRSFEAGGKGVVVGGDKRLSHGDHNTGLKLWVKSHSILSIDIQDSTEQNTGLQRRSRAPRSLGHPRAATKQLLSATISHIIAHISGGIGAESVAFERRALTVVFLPIRVSENRIEYEKRERYSERT